MTWFPDDWRDLFALETPVAELAARGSVLYLALLVLLRLIPRRAGGELATMDLIFLLLISQAASNAFGHYTSVTEGLVVIVVLVAWDCLVNAISYRFRFFERLVSAPPLLVVRDGKMLRRNMRREFLTEDELMSFLRTQHIDSLEQVRRAYVEGDGTISVVKARS